MQADKAAAGAGGGFSFFGGKTEKYENAADLYTQAANAFRMQKQGVELFVTPLYDLGADSVLSYRERGRASI